jgi:hypothetical protein
MSLTLALAAATVAGAALDEHTTFLAHFDTGATADYCVGDWRAGFSGEPTLTEGKFGSALELAAGKSLVYPAQGKINPDAGTIELWLKWLWEPGVAPRAAIFIMQTDAGSYLRVNTVTGGKLGMAYSVGTGDDLNWHRVEIQPPTWQPGEWHHVAGTWGEGIIRLYIDGKLVAEDEGIAPLEGAITNFTLGRGPLVIDELHISAVARSADEIMTSALAEPDQITTTYLTALEPADSGQAVGSVGIDAEMAIDDREMPLTIGATAYARGVAVRAPGFIEFALPEGIAKLTGVAGVSGFASEDAAVTLTVSVDGEAVFDAGPAAAGDDPVDVDVTVAGGKTVRLEAAGAGTGVFADLALLAEGIGKPLPFAREMDADEMAIQMMRTHVAEFYFELPENPHGYMFYAGHPVDMLATDVEPSGEKWPEAMVVKASPGEYEAIQFAIFAAEDLDSVTISCDGLSGPREIGADAVDVRLVRRGLQRKGYWMPRKPANFETVSRFLMPNRDFWLPAGNFKQAQVIVHVPEDAAPGKYTGTVTVAPRGGDPFSFALNLEVFPIELVQPADKRYGMYYRFGNMTDAPEALEAELADMAAHGCTSMVPGVGIEFAKAEDGTITWSFEQIEAMLEGLRRHGGVGPIPVHDNIIRLGALMGHKGIAKDGTGEPMADKEDLLDVCREVFFELKGLNADYPEFEICLTHLDEVFNRERLARYIDIAEVVRKTTDMRLYITHHTQPGRWEEPMQQSDPYIDLRSMNGHSLETWLHAGHSFDEMRDLLEASGDEAWIYHNMRGSFFEAEWNRIINGVWMWQSPIVAHVAWMYYHYSGNAFDDTDADGFDFGYGFPSADDPTEMISTLHWESFREGIDDMRYIVTLEELIARADEAGVDAGAAKTWLADMGAMIPQAPGDIMDIDEESPLCVAISRAFSGADYDRMRWHTADQIIALQDKLGQ